MNAMNRYYDSRRYLEEQRTAAIQRIREVRAWIPRVIATRLQKLDAYVQRSQHSNKCRLTSMWTTTTYRQSSNGGSSFLDQVCMDIAGYLIAQLGLRSPAEPEIVFAVLEQSILPRELAKRMAGMVRFRNILVHDYLEIDSYIVHTSLAGELDDFAQFAKIIAQQYLSVVTP